MEMISLKKMHLKTFSDAFSQINIYFIQPLIKLVTEFMVVIPLASTLCNAEDATY